MNAYNAGAGYLGQFKRMVFWQFMSGGAHKLISK